MATVEVECRIVGPRRDDGLRNIFFEAHGERMTVRALILRTVEEQVRDLNARSELSHQELLRRFARQYQTEEEILALREEAGRAAITDRLSKARTINLGRAQQNALDAFSTGRIAVFVGSEQMDSLEQEIELGAATKVQFLRVLPLRGGCA
jgi:hypothetical protein